MIGDPLIERLRVYRCAQGHGQRDAERLAKLGVNTIGKWEQGGGATLSKVRRLAEALGYSVELVKLPDDKIPAHVKAARDQERYERAQLSQAPKLCKNGHDIRRDSAIVIDSRGSVICVKCRRDSARRYYADNLEAQRARIRAYRKRRQLKANVGPT